MTAMVRMMEGGGGRGRGGRRRGGREAGRGDNNDNDYETQ